LGDLLYVVDAYATQLPEIIEGSDLVMSIPRDTEELGDQQTMAMRTVLGKIASSKLYTAEVKTHFVTSYSGALKALRSDHPAKNFLAGLLLGLRMWAAS